jgi:phage gpG-like protein
MAKQSKFNLGKIEKGGRTAMERSIILIGNEAKNFFVNSWRLQGFEDRSVQKWTPRKKQDKKRAGRAILVDSGDLKRSIIREPVNKTQLSVKISTDSDYAKIHNEGLMGKAYGKYPFKMPKRQFMGDSYKLNELCKKIIISQLDKIFK